MCLEMALAWAISNSLSKVKFSACLIRFALCFGLPVLFWEDGLPNIWLPHMLDKWLIFLQLRHFTSAATLHSLMGWLVLPHCLHLLEKNTSARFLLGLGFFEIWLGFVLSVVAAHLFLGSWRMTKWGATRLAYRKYIYWLSITGCRREWVRLYTNIDAD